MFVFLPFLILSQNYVSPFNFVVDDFGDTPDALKQAQEDKREGKKKNSAMEWKESDGHRVDLSIVEFDGDGIPVSATFKGGRRKVVSFGDLDNIKMVTLDGGQWKKTYLHSVGLHCSFNDEHCITLDEDAPFAMFLDDEKPPTNGHDTPKVRVMCWLLCLSYSCFRKHSLSCTRRKRGSCQIVIMLVDLQGR